MSGKAGTDRGHTRPDTNGLAAVATLTYLGFALLLVQVGIIPLLPVIGKELHLTAGVASWILTITLLAGAIALALVTRLADLWGKRPLILASLLVVLAGAVIGSVSDSLPLLLLGRALMGAQLPMLALPEAIASDTMSPGRARLAISAIHGGTGLGVAAGVLLGALVGAHPAAYHAYFVVSAAAVGVGVIATLVFVRDSSARAAGGLDVLGAALLTLALVSLLLGLSEGPAWGWGSLPVILLLLGGVGLFVLWYAQERRASHPLISMERLANPALRLPYVLTFLVSFGIFGSLSAVTRLAVTPHRLAGFGFSNSSLAVGLFAIPFAFGPPLGAVLVQQVGRRRGQLAAVACSLVLYVAGYFGVVAVHDSQPLVMACAGLFSMASAMAVAATQVMIVRAVPPWESGIALGLSVVIYAVSTSVGSVVLGVLFSSLTLPNGMPALSSYLLTFAIYGALAVIGLLLCLAESRRSAQSAAGVHVAAE